MQYVVNVYVGEIKFHKTIIMDRQMISVDKLFYMKYVYDKAQHPPW